MEWYELIAWVVAVGGGAYGAWRSWRTDRSLKLLGETWRVEHFENDAWLITNRQTSDALDVRIAVPHGWTGPRVDGELSRMRPNDAVKIVSARTLGASSDFVTIEWRTPRGRRRSKSVALRRDPRPAVALTTARRFGREVH